VLFPALLITINIADQNKLYNSESLSCQKLLQ